MKVSKPSTVTLLALSIAALVATAAFGLLVRGRAHLKLIKSLIVATERSHPDVLWRIIRDGCVVDKSSLGSPVPCLEVNLARGYAVIKDPERPTQLLLVPTIRIPGIESPILLATNSENYWFDAWYAKHWLERDLGAPVDRDAIGLAVNSRLSRTQDQLHIHIDCVRPEVQVVIKENVKSLSQKWTKLPRRFLGSEYDARWIDSDELNRSNPFQILARDRRVRNDMQSYSLALIGARRPNGQLGFVLFRSRETAADFETPTGERLLDHHCQVLRSPDIRR